MTRLRQALDNLNQKGYAISSLKRLSGGINSAVFQAKSSDGIKYVVKLYRLPSKDDPRNRCRTEQDFLKHLQACQVHNTPTLLESNISAGWSLISWIAGQKPASLELTDLQEITEFIIRINEISAEATRSQLQPASEACESLPGLITSISGRIKRLQSSTPRSQVGHDAIRWISKTIEPRFHSISQRLLDSRSSCCHWQDLHGCRIASPSDVGIHNTLRTSQGLYFLDFEYAGIDDLSKLVADWILQPECTFNKEKEIAFIDNLSDQFSRQNSGKWIQRFSDIKPLIHIKWCLIMLNNLKTNQLDKRQFSKVKYYYSATPSYFRI